MTTHMREQPTSAVTLPAQARPVQPSSMTTTTAGGADHVRKHGRSCWWDVAECRWVCNNC